MTNCSNLPDIEVSRIIAEKVMGFEPYSDGNPDHFWVPNPMGGIPVTIKHGERWDFSAGVLVFDPANDPVAVFGPGGVVERMNNRGLVLGLRQVWNEDGTTLWQASFDSNQNQYYNTQQDSPTRAVCLAALTPVIGL